MPRNGKTAVLNASTIVRVLFLIAIVFCALVIPMATRFLNVAKVEGFPLGFFLAAHGNIVLIAALSVAYIGIFSEQTKNDRAQHRTLGDIFSGMRFVAAGLAVPILFGVLDANFSFGYDSLAISLGCIAGLVLSFLLFAPKLNALNVQSFPGLFRAQGRGDSLIFVVTVLTALFYCALIVALMAILMPMIDRLFPWEVPLASRSLVFIGVIGVLVLVLLYPGVRFVITCLGVFVVSGFLFVAGWVGWSELKSLIPQLGYGSALATLAESELAALQSGAADPVTFKRFASPALHFDAKNFFALTLAAMLATAAASVIFFSYKADGTGLKSSNSASMIWPVVIVAVILITTPMLAVLAKLGLLQDFSGRMSADVPSWLFGGNNQHLIIKFCGQIAVNAGEIAIACSQRENATGPLQVDDIALSGWHVVPFLLAKNNAPIWIWHVYHGVWIGALLSMLIAVCNGLRKAVGDAWYAPRLPKGAKAIVPMVLFLILFVVVFFVFYLFEDVVEIPQYAILYILGIAGGSALAVLAVSLWWPNVPSPALSVGLLVGTLIAVFYVIAPLYYPVLFYQFTGTLSDANPDAITDYQELLALWQSGTRGDPAETWLALSQQAKAMSNWWGFEPFAAGLFGFIGALVTMILIAPFSRAHVQESSEVK